MRELERFAGPVLEELEAVEQRIDSLLSTLSRGSAYAPLYARYVQPPVRHLFRTGGKLLRPLLILLSARTAGLEEPTTALIAAAAAVELIHTASLAHDDMIDESDSRRGAPSLHREYGSTTAVLVGDLLYARFFREIAALPGSSPSVRLRLLDVFLGVTARMCEGEILEEQLRADGRRPTLDLYLHVTETKTADLVSACCLAGAILGGADEGLAGTLGGFGRALGLLFQVADDLVDGDAPIEDRSLLADKAEDYRRTAEALLLALPRNDASRALAEMPYFILASAPR
jgi:octaprenyl-diphosphate synthase